MRGGTGGGSSAPGFWSAPSPLGVASRPATELLMSAYDTDPASVDQTAAFASAFAAAAAILAAEKVSMVDLVLDTRQKYQLGGAVTVGPHGENAQVILPFSNTWSGTIRLVGMPGSDASYIGQGGGGHAVIESTLGAAPAFVAANGIASMFGGPAAYSTAARTMSMLRFATRDVVLRAANPFIAGIDAGWLAGFFGDGHLGFTTDYWDQLVGYPVGLSGVAVCSNQQAIPIITPLINTFYGSKIEELSVAGWYCGPLIGEAVHINELRVLATNLCLPVDVASEGSLIHQLYDWNNGYGIGTCGPSNTPTSPTATGLASHATAVIPSPLNIVNWQNQLSAATAPAALKRSSGYDVLDANNLLSVTASMRSNQGGTGGGLVVRNPTILGAGSSATGGTNCRIVDANRAPGPRANTPASGTTVRNPFSRDALVVITAGAVTAVSIDGTAGFPVAGPWLVRANGTINLTWSASPTLQWILT